MGGWFSFHGEETQGSFSVSVLDHGESAAVSSWNESGFVIRKKYAGRYPYQYGTGYANEVLFNDHFADTPAIVTIYGPCAEPKIYIGGNVYGVEANAEEGERIVLDQIERKIYRVDATGATTNLFDYRIKTSDPFKKISPGDVTVQFSGEFGFDIELLQQRSEPKWI